MLPKWLFGFALIFGILVGSTAMAAACPQRLAHDQAASHSATGEGHGKHVPAKQVDCTGPCSAIEMSAPQMSARMALRPAKPSVASIRLLDGIFLERDTPPPRMA